MSVAYNPIFVILAAGLSRRFNGIKMLAHLKVAGRSTTILQHMINRLQPLQHPIVVATGEYHERIAEKTNDNVVYYKCSQAHLGMGHTMSQITSYIDTQYQDITHIAFVLGDQVALTTADLKTLNATAKQNPLQIIYSKTKQHITAPAVFPRTYWTAVKKLTGDKGAKSIILMHIDNAVAVSLDKAHFDIDQQEQLIQWNELNEVIHDHA